MLVPSLGVPSVEEFLPDHGMTKVYDPKATCGCSSLRDCGSLPFIVPRQSSGKEQRQRSFQGNRRAVRTTFLSIRLGLIGRHSVQELARKRNVKVAQISVAWSIKKSTAPIVGTSKLENLDDMIGE